MAIRGYGGPSLSGLRLPNAGGNTLLNTKPSVGGPSSFGSPIRPDDLLRPTFGKDGSTPLNKLPALEVQQPKLPGLSDPMGPLEGLRQPPAFQVGPRPTASSVVEEPLPVPTDLPQPGPALDPRIDPRWTPGPLNPSGPFNPDPNANPLGWNDPNQRNLDRLNQPWTQGRDLDILIDSNPATSGSGPKENPWSPDSPRNTQNVPVTDPGFDIVRNVPDVVTSFPDTAATTQPDFVVNTTPSAGSDTPVVTYPTPERKPPAPDPLQDMIQQRFMDLLSGKNPAMDQAQRIALNALGGQQKNSEAAAHQNAVRMGLAPGTPGYQEVQDSASRSVASSGSDLLSGLAQKGLDQQNQILDRAGNWNYKNRVLGASESQAEIQNLDFIIENPDLFSVDQVNQAKTARGSIVGAGSGGRPDDPDPVRTRKELIEVAKVRGEANPEAWADNMYRTMTDAQMKGLIKLLESGGLTEGSDGGSGGGESKQDKIIRLLDPRNVVDNSMDTLGPLDPRDWL